MDMLNIRTKSLWQAAKTAFIFAFSTGLSFKQLFSIYINYFRCYVVPHSLEYLIDCFVAFFLFHLYLAYVLSISISRSVWKHFKLKGKKIVPEVKAAKDRLAVFLTYFLVFQSISRWSIGMPMFDRIFGWAMQIRPQINFKPQIKFDNNQEVSIKPKYDTNFAMSLESEDEDTQKSLKSLSKMAKNVQFASDLVEGFDNGVIGGEKEKEEDLDESVTLVEKWLQDEGSQDGQVVRQHLMKLVAQDVMRRRSFCMPKKKKKDEEESRA